MIQVTKEAYLQIVELRYESCGFLVGRDGKFSHVHRMVNHSKKHFKYKMSKLDILKFIIRFLFSKYNQFIVYHCHQFEENLSFEDMNRMIPGIVYGISFNRKLYFYEKTIYGNIFAIPHECITEKENGTRM